MDFYNFSIPFMSTQREYFDQYNTVLKEMEQNYIKELEQLHQKQFDNLPEQVQKLIDEKYGDRMYQYYIGIADSGFAVDMGALDGRLTPRSSENMYSDMYRYQFKKVL